MSLKLRQYSLLDQVCMNLDQALRAISPGGGQSIRPYPANTQAEAPLTDAERQHIAGLMRVNHAGEVAAQALYHGQACVTRDPALKAHLHQAALEEGDHLAWCHKRLVELGSHASYFNPIWYMGSFCIGFTAGMIGDAYSLGFVAETERQVITHLQEHLDGLPKQDRRTAAVLQQMQADEDKHRIEALQSGALTLPTWIQKLMRLTSKVMVKVAYAEGGFPGFGNHAKDKRII